MAPVYDYQEVRLPMSDPETTRTIAPLFTWRSAIAESDLAPTTRHVLLTLSTYMNERGGSAYPGAARLAKDSGLHIDTVKDHLRKADVAGWLKVVMPGGSIAGGKRLATEYVASVPGVEDPRYPDDRGSCSDDRGSSPVRPGVQDPPITSLITPENSRRVSVSAPPPWRANGVGPMDWGTNG